MRSKKMTTHKLSVDLTKESKEILEKLKNERKFMYGNTINALITTFGDMPEKVKKELLSFVKIKIKSLIKEFDHVSTFQTNDLDKQIQVYIELANFFSDGQKISLQTLKDEPTLKKYQIKNGFLICPENWIVLNIEQADTMMYAGVVECRNSKIYGKQHFNREIPSFVFFTDKKYSTEYDNYFKEYINKLCIKKFKDFEKVIQSQVNPIDDPDSPGCYLNFDEWIKAPSINYFSIYENDDTSFGINYEPPSNARIVRTNV